ncbi:hypothetical protein Agabi119p4_6751 [Agaricus bisporus var. burnettii]|uniref:Uncharacterized protein n=1 Tax=Agaricus bisporus var. burnettii TaxID=192524 RepID=A0A8H7CEA6_AGABI|nr:hypothetical protein Agabi119p4_6751 [Agaricus bisporus var. burnettii]
MSPSMRDKYRSKKFNIIPFIPQKEFLVEVEEEAQAPETVLMSASTLIFPLKSRQFTLRIVIAIITLHQLGYSLKRFKSLHLPEGEPILRYDTGMLSRALLTPYTVIYLLFNILHAVLVAGGGGSFHLPDGFPIGSALTSQLAIVLFYATLLSIIAYRQKIQLNPAQNILNLKAVLDGTLLVTILALGIAQDAVPGTALIPNDPEDQKRIVILRNLFAAFQVFVFLPKSQRGDIFVHGPCQAIQRQYSGQGM